MSQGACARPPAVNWGASVRPPWRDRISHAVSWSGYLPANSDIPMYRQSERKRRSVSLQLKSTPYLDRELNLRYKGAEQAHR